MKKLVIIFVCAVFLCAGARADSFKQIKDRLSSSKCVSLEFLSILQSDVFKSVDTSHGLAYLAKDGRYLVSVGPDIYLSDNRKQYSYSSSNNQVVEQKADSTGNGAGELFYNTRLDEWFKTTILQPDRVYRLTRKGTGSSPLPDSMTVFIDKNKGRIVRIEYLDVNEEKVTIVILKESFPAACDEARFVPHFPDTVETVKM
jgi:outer membrane lipoprotein-sorting protein